MHMPIEMQSKPLVAIIIFIFPNLIRDPVHNAPIIIPEFDDTSTIFDQKSF